MGKVSGDPFLLGKKAGEAADQGEPGAPGKPARRNQHSFRDPRMACILGAGRRQGEH